MKENKQVILDAPGAGLPWLETKLAKVGFKILCMLKKREYFTGQFAAEADLINGLIDNSSDDELGERVLIDRIVGIEDSSRNWSVWMTLEHLSIVNLGMTEIIENLVNNNKDLPKVSVADVKPSDGATFESKNKFNLSVKSTIARVSRLRSLKKSRKHHHPWFGELDASQWHALLSVHMKIHRNQIEKILAGQ